MIVQPKGNYFLTTKLEIPRANWRYYIILTTVVSRSEIIHKGHPQISSVYWPTPSLYNVPIFSYHFFYYLLIVDVLYKLSLRDHSYIMWAGFWTFSDKPTHYVSMFYVLNICKICHFLNQSTQSFAYVIYEWSLTYPSHF
jgi:hypothetical protein